MLNISFRILLLENEKLSMQETLVMMSVTSAIAPARPPVHPSARTHWQGGTKWTRISTRLPQRVIVPIVSKGFTTFYLVYLWWFLGGSGKGFDTLVRISTFNKMACARSPCGGFQYQSFAF